MVTLYDTIDDEIDGNVEQRELERVSKVVTKAHTYT